MAVYSIGLVMLKRYDLVDVVDPTLNYLTDLFKAQGYSNRQVHTLEMENRWNQFLDHLFFFEEVPYEDLKPNCRRTSL